MPALAIVAVAEEGDRLVHLHLAAAPVLAEAPRPLLLADQADLTRVDGVAGAGVARAAQGRPRRLALPRQQLGCHGLVPRQLWVKVEHFQIFW